MPRLARLAAPLLAAAAVAAVPGAAQASVVGRLAGLEGGTLAQFDQVNQANATVATVAGDAYTGTTSALATFAGAQTNGYARGLFNVAWDAGDDVWYRAAYFLPVGFKAAMQGQVALLRWDNWVSHPTDTDHGGVVIYGSDKRARLAKERLVTTAQTDIGGGAFDVPEGRWFLLEVHQRFGSVDGSALNEVFLDGTRVLRSTAANLDAGRSVERIRFGIVAIDGGRQALPLSLRFDDAAVALSGPAAPRDGAVAAPTPAPAVTTTVPDDTGPAPAPAVPVPTPAAPTPAPASPATSPTTGTPAPAAKRCTKTTRVRVGGRWVTRTVTVACPVTAASTTTKKARSAKRARAHRRR